MKKKTLVLVSFLTITIIAFFVIGDGNAENTSYEHTSSMIVITDKFVEEGKFYIEAYDPNSSTREEKTMEVESEDVYYLLELNKEYLSTYTLMADKKIRVDEIKLPE
ncbi:hypothetical protein [Halobacillus sp. Marseille-P3879]|uniref:hypothetical protein n=1 Tax=Halobacillus sp. Marseille-P3879 TaxID=2045014 RepID=UPI000C7ADF15|nr:hypothetical protein [Halobacillus sp. Marseille-P3879]